MCRAILPMHVVCLKHKELHYVDSKKCSVNSKNEQLRARSASLKYSHMKYNVPENSTFS
jgi:hypothetical protein